MSSPSSIATQSASNDGSTPTINVGQIELLIHNGINSEREKNGLPSMAWNEKLNLIARGHSQDMIDRAYFEHDSPDGHDFAWRYAQGGYSCNIEVGNTIYNGAENIFQGYTYSYPERIVYSGTGKKYSTNEEIAADAVNGWMNSPGHRQNILEPFWKSEGIGIAIALNGELYATENFC